MWPSGTRTPVTGGAGFPGSRVCDTLVTRGEAVLFAENFHTGRIRNLVSLWEHSRRGRLREVMIFFPVHLNT